MNPAALPPSAIAALPFVTRLVCLEEIDSTSMLARREGKIPDRGMLIYWARRQHAGRGRNDRSFFSSTEGGLWVTLVLRLADICGHFAINRALSLAVCSAVREMCPGAPLAIKWPNDIFWNEHKLCGILLETASHMPHALIVGFGLNVNIDRRHFPEELQSIATSLFAETGAEYDLTLLLKRLLEHYVYFIGSDPDTVHDQYRSVLYGQGRAAVVESTQGILADVLPDGRLVLESGTGTRLCSGGTLRFL